MKKRWLLVALVSFCSLGFASWERDYSKALEKGQSSGQPLLLFFTGSDWCGFGMKMKKEILDTPEFLQTVEKECLCVEIDFPRHTPLSQKQQALHAHLREEFGVTSLPFLLLVDPNEQIIARVGGAQKGGEWLAQEIVRLKEEHGVLQHELSLLRKASYSEEQLRHLYTIALELGREDACERLIDKALSTSDSLFFLLEKYQRLLRQNQEMQTHIVKEKILQQDEQAAFTLALLDFQHFSRNSDVAADPERIIEPLKEYLEHYSAQDQEHSWQIAMMVMQFYLDQDRWEQALHYGKWALDHAPEPRKAEISQSLSYIHSHSQVVTK